MALFIIITRSNSIENICKPCQISASDLKPVNKISNGKEKNLIKQFLESLQLYQMIDPK